MRCESCNAYIPEGSTYCLECNTPLDSVFTCQRCGASTSEKAKFCRKCGYPIIPPPGISMHVEPEKNKDIAKHKCLRCGNEVPSGIRYCPICGTNQDKHRDAGESINDVDTEKSENKSNPTDLAGSGLVCPLCGTAARGSGRFCHDCGKFLGGDIEDVLCPSCGATNILRYARCQYCGKELPARKEK